MLKSKTSQAWLNEVLANFDDFLLDHASCERKASGMALSFVAHYPDRPELVRAMIALAQEELEHFRQVWVRINERGLYLGPDTKDQYVRKLRGLMRADTSEYFLDRLLVCGVIEARGNERFGMIADALEADSPLKSFYVNITRSEAKHKDLFFDLAAKYFDPSEIELRLEEILRFEAKVVEDLPIKAALH